MLTIDHIGIAVNDAEVIERVLNTLAECAPAVPEDIIQQGVRARFYGDETRIEVLESIDHTSDLKRSLDKRGPGLHHIAFRVNNIQLQFHKMCNEGFIPLTDSPVFGANGKRIFFLDPRDTGGILVEFCQLMNQYTVLFDQCDELEKTMLSSGRCITSGSDSEHVVTSQGVSSIGRSVVIHNASKRLVGQELESPSVPILISEVSTQSTHAYQLQCQWPDAQVVVLPVSIQHKCLPAVIFDFWESIDHG